MSDKLKKAARQARYRQRHPERILAQRRKYYGPKVRTRKRLAKGIIGLPETEGTECEICARADEVLCADHCHVTGKFRGWLCRKCNTALGMLGDSAIYAARALEYLSK